MAAPARQHQIHGLQAVLPVPDVLAAVDWFGRVLGFELDFLFGNPVQHGRVKAGDGSWGQVVYLHLARQEGAIQPCGQTRLHVGHDIDGLHAHVLAQGGTVLMPPTDQPWGLREMTLQTPGGHQLLLGAEMHHAAPAADAPRVVIAGYRPHAGQADTLLHTLRRHVPTLQRLGLATRRAPTTLRAADGTLLEVFEWASAAAIEAAHHHPEVQAMWADFAAVCEFVTLAQLPEAQRLFAEFTAVDV